MHSAESILPCLSSTGVLGEIHHLPQRNTAQTSNLFHSRNTKEAKAQAKSALPTGESPGDLGPSSATVLLVFLCWKIFFFLFFTFGCE